MFHLFEIVFVSIFLLTLHYLRTSLSMQFSMRTVISALENGRELVLEVGDPSTIRLICLRCTLFVHPLTAYTYQYTHTHHLQTAGSTDDQDLPPAHKPDSRHFQNDCHTYKTEVQSKQQLKFKGQENRVQLTPELMTMCEWAHQLSSVYLLFKLIAFAQTFLSKKKEFFLSWFCPDTRCRSSLSLSLSYTHTKLLFLVDSSHDG